MQKNHFFKIIIKSLKVPALLLVLISLLTALSATQAFAVGKRQRLCQDTTPMESAVREKDLEKFDRLLRTENVNEVDCATQTALIAAVTIREPVLGYSEYLKDTVLVAQIVEKLLVAGASVDATDSRGNTALFYSVGGAYREASNLLLKYGADINHQNLEGKSLLMNDFDAPLGSPDNEQYQDLINGGINIHLKDINDHTALQQTCKVGFITLLLAVGANPNETDKHGWTPLLNCASRTDYPDSLTVLLKAGAKVNYQEPYGRTALIEASKRNTHEFLADRLRTLLSYGANPNLEDENGITALQYVVTGKELILDYADVDLLLSAHADINHQDKTGTTAFMISICSDFPNSGGGLYRHMVNSGATLNLRDKYGRTALDLLWGCGWNDEIYKEMYEFLISKGATR